MAVHDPGELIPPTEMLAIASPVEASPVPTASPGHQELVDASQNFRRQTLDDLAIRRPELFHKIQNDLAFMDTIDGLSQKDFEDQCTELKFNELVMDYLGSSRGGES